MPASNYKPRVVLQFNEYDFRHRKVLEILRSNKRHMTDLVVNAILHFISCPEVESEFSKEHIRNIVMEVIAEICIDDLALPVMELKARDRVRLVFSFYDD